MSSPLSSFSVLSLLAALALTSSSHAGMSVQIGDLEGVIKSNPRFDSLFINNLEFGPSGTAVRLEGPHRDISGKPAGPYQFPARFASDEGSDYPLIATLHTKLIFENSSGDIVTSPQEASSVREHLVRVEIQDAAGLTPEEITKTLNQLFEGSKSAGGGGTEEKMEGAVADGGKAPETPSSPKEPGAGAFANELKEGDRKYAGEYHCDDYTVKVKAGDTLEVTFQPNGFIPVIMSKKNGKYSNSAGRFDGEAINDFATFSYTSPIDAEVIISLTTRDKGEAGTYEASFTLEGKTLNPASNGDGSGYVALQ